MAERIHHLVHLQAHGLRWLSVAEHARTYAVRSSGELEGEPAAALDAWGERVSALPGPVYIYDSRLAFYALRLSLPKQAAIRADDAIRLKIRQDLGLGPEAVCWSTLRTAAPPPSHEVSFLAYVARRNGLAVVQQWIARQQLGPVWVGADLSAIATLAEQAAPARPLVVAHAFARGRLLYFAAAGQPPRRVASSGAGGTSEATPAVADFDWPRAQRLAFGENGSRESTTAIAQVDALAPLPLPNFGSQPGARRLAEFPVEQLQRDPVLLGGLLQLAAGGPVLPTLLGEPGGNSLWRGVLREQPQRRLLAGSVLCLGLLLLSVWAYRRQQAADRDQLLTVATRLSTATTALNGQAQTLQQVRAERPRSMATVIQNLHQDAPDGITLDGFSVASNGQVKITGNASQADLANTYFRSLSDDVAFAPGSVLLQEVKPVPNQNGKVTFTIAAQVRARGGKP